MKNPTHLRIALAAAIVLALLGWTQTPAASHVGSWAHNWTAHIKAKTDARYYTKSQVSSGFYNKLQSDRRFYAKGQADTRFQPETLPSGGTTSGIWAVAAATGEWASTAINFAPRLPAAVEPHFVAPGAASTTACPGTGQAAPGHLCVYATWVTNVTLSQFFNPQNGVPDSTSPRGTVLFMNASATKSNAVGTWTATAP
jgi:hypothetical protein